MNTVKENIGGKKVLAELAITRAIQCIQETLKKDNLTDVRKKMLKKKLIVFYVHVFLRFNYELEIKAIDISYGGHREPLH